MRRTTRTTKTRGFGRPTIGRTRTSKRTVKKPKEPVYKIQPIGKPKPIEERRLKLPTQDQLRTGDYGQRKTTKSKAPVKRARSLRRRRR